MDAAGRGLVCVCAEALQQKQEEVAQQQTEQATNK